MDVLDKLATKFSIENFTKEQYEEKLKANEDEIVSEKSDEDEKTMQERIKNEV